MRRHRTLQAQATSRRGGITTASAALVCLGALLTTGCGSSGDDGYVAVGAADPSERGGTGADADGHVPPKGGVKFVPLDGDGEDGGAAAGKGGGADGSGSSGGPSRSADGKGEGASPDAGSAGDAGAGSSSGSAPGSGTGAGSGGATGGSGGSSATPGSGSGAGSGPGSGSGSGSSGGGSASKPSGPAVLQTGKPQRKKTDDRWCEKVTVEFRNTGGATVGSGTVTFATHIIGSLGVDWATRESTRKLPTPIAAGEKKQKTWTVCVDEWRVPLGMHIETQSVKVTGWK